MMILSKLSEREKKILYVVVALLIVLFGYHGVWNPMQAKLATMDEEIFAMQMKLRKAKIFIRQKSDVEEAAKKFANLEQMDAGTDEEEIARLLNLIEQTARKNGVSLSDVKPEPVKSDKITKRYTIELNAEASLESLMPFIYEIEHSPEILKIEKTNINPKEDKSSVMRASIVVTRVMVK